MEINFNIQKVLNEAIAAKSLSDQTFHPDRHVKISVDGSSLFSIDSKKKTFQRDAPSLVTPIKNNILGFEEAASGALTGDVSSLETVYLSKHARVYLDLAVEIRRQLISFVDKVITQPSS